MMLLSACADRVRDGVGGDPTSGGVTSAPDPTGTTTSATTGSTTPATTDPVPPPEGKVLLTLQAGKKGPKSVLAFGTESQVGTNGSGCWTWSNGDGTGGGGCADTVGAYAPEDPIAIPAGTPIVLESDAKGAHGEIGVIEGGADVGRLHRRQDLHGINGELVDVPSGNYVLEVWAHWPEGSKQIDFSIRVT